MDLVALFLESRLWIALGGTLLAAYFDVKDRTEVPSMVVLGLLMAGFASMILDWGVMMAFSVLVAGVLALSMGWLCWRWHWIGEADVYVLMAIALLVPGIKGVVPFMALVLWSTVVFVLVDKYVVKSIIKTREYPFLPFICAGLIVSLIFFLYY